MIAYTANDHVVRLTGAAVVSLTTGESVPLGATATVEFRIQTGDYIDVGGETWPRALTYIEGSDGDFIGLLSAAVEIEAGIGYRFIGSVDNGTDQVGVWDIPLPVLARH